KAFKKVLDAGNAIVLKIVDLMMLFAPYGVFALIAALIAEAPSFDVFKALGMYAFTVLLGLLLIVYGVYSIFIYCFGRMNPFRFFLAILPWQCQGFVICSNSTSFPLPVVCAEENLHIKNDSLHLLLSIGSNINMDGTCLYQGVAAVFISKVMGYYLS